VSPRTFPPPPGWAPDGHRIKAPLDYGRGPDKGWVYGALRERDGRAVTLTAPARNTAGYLRLLAAVARTNPTGELYLIADNLSSHKTATRARPSRAGSRRTRVSTRSSSPKAPAG
jgi:hypothetical protein